MCHSPLNGESKLTNGINLSFYTHIHTQTSSKIVSGHRTSTVCDIFMISCKEIISEILGIISFKTDQIYHHISIVLISSKNILGHNAILLYFVKMWIDIKVAFENGGE